MQKVTGIIIAILESRNAELFQIVDAGNAPRFLFRLVQSRQQHPGKDGDDRNHDEELDQGENLCFPPARMNDIHISPMISGKRRQVLIRGAKLPSAGDEVKSRPATQPE